MCPTKDEKERMARATKKAIWVLCEEFGEDVPTIACCLKIMVDEFKGLTGCDPMRVEIQRSGTDEVG